jgi:hypothetical protein
LRRGKHVRSFHDGASLPANAFGVAFTDWLEGGDCLFAQQRELIAVRIDVR